MATCGSRYSSTQETTNANRACRLLLGPCTDQLRDVLRKRVPPSTFFTVIKKHEFNLPRLSPPQRNLILPQKGCYTGNYEEFDISLLYILLRNICNISPHKNGWGNIPSAYDSSLSANIERIRIARNNSVHSSAHYLTNREFNDIWTSVRVAVVEMDTFLSNGCFYEKEVDILRHTTMDPVQDKHYRDQLAKQYTDDQETKECVRSLQESIGSYQKETTYKITHLEESQKTLEEEVNIYSQQQRQFKDELKENLYQRKLSCIPENIREQQERILDSWKTGVFFKTSSFKTLQDFFASHQIVAVVGSPGSGKTSLIRHIALQLESKYQIVPISKLEDILTYGDLHKKQIFTIDDVLGVFTLEREVLSYLERHKEQIENLLDMKSKRSKLFMSCRLAVYHEAKKLQVDFFKDENILNLESEKNNLTPHDRKGMFDAHLKHAGISYKIDPKILHRKEVIMFPLLCQIFSSDKCMRVHGAKFFTSPSDCLLEEIDKIEKRNNLQYLSMVLCMLNNNCLTEEILSNEEMLERVFRSCKVKGIHQNWEILEELSNLRGTYVTKRDKSYIFIHDSIFEVVAYHYGQQFPNQILKYMNSHFLANKVVLETDARNDLCIKVNKSEYLKLAYRLYKDVKEGKFHDVFSKSIKELSI